MSDDRVPGRKGVELITEAASKYETLRPSTVRLAQALVGDAEARKVKPPVDIVEIATFGRPLKSRTKGGKTTAKGPITTWSVREEMSARDAAKEPS